MAVEEQVRALIGQGRPQEALALVRQAAETGDNWARLALAQWLLDGASLPRDPAAAVALLDAASAEGVAEASLRLMPLVASGTGCQADHARARRLLESLCDHDPMLAAQRNLLEREPDPDQFESEDLHQSPLVRLYRGFASRAETAWVRTFAQPQLQPSMVEEPGTGKRIPHPVRTSDGMSFGPLNLDLVIDRLTRRIARLSGTDAGCAEPLHVLRYRPGQQYRPHIDALPGVANQRQLTAILFCNDGFAGGETRFPRLDLTVRAREGDLLLFANVQADGTSDARSEHAGLPVIEGEKWIATRWIRQQRYHPWDAETAR